MDRRGLYPARDRVPLAKLTYIIVEGLGVLPHHQGDDREAHGALEVSSTLILDSISFMR